VVTFIQAMRGQPLLAPDALTAGLALIVVGVGLAIAWVVRTGSFRMSVDPRSPRMAARGPRPS